MTKKKDPKDFDKLGRPTKMTAEIVSDLKTAFAYSFTDEEACTHAGIGTTTLYRYEEANPEFRELKHQLKNKPNMKGKMILVSKMLGERDAKNDPIYTDEQLQIAKWWLERKNKKEFSTRTEQIASYVDELDISDADREEAERAVLSSIEDDDEEIQAE